MANQSNPSSDQSNGELLADGGTSGDEWTDIQLSEPGDDSWDIDLQLERGTVRTVVLRFHAGGLPGIVNSLLSDVDDETVRNVLTRVLERQAIDLAELHTEE